MISYNTDSRTQKSFINVTTGFVLQVLTILLSFAVRIVFVRKIGYSYLGISSLFSNILTILSVADLGFGTAISISLYSALRKADEDKIAGIINYYKKIYLTISLIIFVAGCIICPFISKLVNTSEPVKYLELYFMIFLVNLISTYLISYRHAIIKADQKNGILNLIHSIVLICKSVVELCVVLIMPLFVSQDIAYITYLVVMVVSTYAIEIWSAAKAKKMYPYAFKKVNIEPEEKKEIKTNVVNLLFYKVCYAVNKSADSILISIFVSTTILGKYDNYVLIISTLMGFGCILSRNLIASLGNFMLDESKERQIQIFNIINVAYSLITAFFVVNYIGILEPFFVVAFGNDSTLSVAVLILAAVHLAFNCNYQVNELFRETTKMFRKTQFIMAINLVLNVGLSVVLGIYIGLEGILLGTVIAYFCTSFWFETFALFKFYFKAPQKTVWLKMIFAVLSIAAFSAASFFINKAITIDNIYVKLVVSILISLVSSGLCILSFGWMPETKQIILKVKRVFKKG